MFARSTSILALASLLSTTAWAAEKTFVIDVSDNLYYSGLIPERYTAPSGGRSYYGTYIPSAGYPDAPIPFSKYAGTPIGDCVRNVYYTDAAGNERAPDPAAGEKLNTFAPDIRTSCFGTPPVVVPLADIGVAAGDTLYLRATGLIDDNAGFGFGPGPVDPRGLPDSDAASDNDIDQYAAIGLFVKPTTSGILESDQAFKNYVDAAWENDILSIIGNPGFEIVDFQNGQKEFALVEDLGLSQTNTFIDNDGDNRADQGTAEFAGSVTIPVGATHLILAYNTAKGGFYHHGDPLYFGADNPLIAGTNGVWPAITTEKLKHDLIITADGEWSTPELLPDLFPNDGLDAEPGDTYAAGAFKITLSDQPITSDPLPPLPEVSIEAQAEGLVVNVSSGDSPTLPASIISYSWDFGDGSPLVTGATASHEYSEAGEYTIRLTVLTDNAQSRSTETTLSLPANTDSPINPATEDTPPDTPETATPSTGTGSTNMAWSLLLLGLLGVRRKKRDSHHTSTETALQDSHFQG